MPDNVAIEPFKFEGIIIDKAITHRIFHKDAEKQKVPPKYSEKILKLDQNSVDTIQARFTKSLGNKSHGIEVAIDDEKEGSFFQLSAQMMHGDAAKYVNNSKHLADKLNNALFQTNAPAGIIAVISGRIGDDACPFVAVIKTDPQDGFKTTDEDDVIGIEYISELLLTESQKFYKIGFLVETLSKPAVDGMYDSNNYRLFLYDHLVTATESRSAAIYFYAQFLGSTILHSAKKLTQDFYEHTVKFINTSDIPDDKKSDILEALRAELKSQKATINPATFAQDHLQENLRARYCAFLEENKFPNHSIQKDTHYIKNKLRNKRRYSFSNNVLILTPPDKMSDYISIENTEEINVTLVKIKGVLQRQE